MDVEYVLCRSNDIDISQCPASSFLVFSCHHYDNKYLFYITPCLYQLFNSYSEKLENNNTFYKGEQKIRDYLSSDWTEKRSLLRNVG